MADPRNLVTFDPNVHCKWENVGSFARLAVTLGRNIGPSPVGGHQFVLVKPAMLSGSDRPGEWGSELTCRIIGCYVPWFHQTETASFTGMLQPGWPCWPCLGRMG